MRTPLLLAAMALLTACAPATTSSSDTSSTAAPASSTPPGVTAQGFTAKKIGEEAGIGCASAATSSCVARFTVTAVDINPTCDRGREPAPAGRKTVVLHVTMTVAEPSKQQAGAARLVFSPLSLKGLDAAGNVSKAEIGHCLDRTDQLDRDIVPNTASEGTVEVTVPETATSITSSSSYLNDGTGGWVWPID